MIGTVPLHLPGRPVAPLERLIASGLDARLATDLSDLGNSSSAIDNQSAIRNPQSALVTPNDRYYIRTSAPVGLEAAAAATPWTIAMRGRPGDTDATAALTMADLERLAVKTGPYPIPAPPRRRCRARPGFSRAISSSARSSPCG